MNEPTLRPDDADALDDGLAAGGTGSGGGAAARIAAVLRAADPAAGVEVPAGLAARAAAAVARSVEAGEPLASPALELHPRDADALDAWLAGGGTPAAPAAFASLANLLDAGLGDAAPAAEADTPPAGLAARTLARLESERRAEALAMHIDRFRGPAGDAAGAMPASGVASRIGFGGRFRGGVRQVLSAAAILFIGTALLLPALRQSATEAGRLACMGNLRAAGSAFAQYAADFGGVLPRAAGFGSILPAGLLPRAAAADPSSPAVLPLPAGDAAGNNRHLRLLVTAGGYLPAGGLVCHGQPGERVDGGHTARIAWRVPGAAAYSYQSQDTPEPLRLDAARSDLGVLADRNPLFVVRDGRLRLRAGLPMMLPSRLHRGEGQNVLTAAGDARWTVRPRLGVTPLPGGAASADHLWMSEGSGPAGGTAPTQVGQDSVLLP